MLAIWLDGHQRPWLKLAIALLSFAGKRIGRTPVDLQVFEMVVHHAVAHVYFERRSLELGRYLDELCPVAVDSDR